VLAVKVFIQVLLGLMYNAQVVAAAVSIAVLLELAALVAAVTEVQPETEAPEQRIPAVVAAAHLTQEILAGTAVLGLFFSAFQVQEQLHLLAA
jgi:hypothetical protein